MSNFSEFLKEQIVTESTTKLSDVLRDAKLEINIYVKSDAGFLEHLLEKNFKDDKISPSTAGNSDYVITSKTNLLDLQKIEKKLKQSKATLVNIDFLKTSF